MALIHWIWIGENLPWDKLKNPARLVRFIGRNELSNQIQTRLWWFPVKKEANLTVTGGRANKYKYEPKNGVIGFKDKNNASFTIPVATLDSFAALIENWPEQKEIKEYTDWMLSLSPEKALPRIILSDLVRLVVLAPHGGLYMDIDTEVHRPHEFEKEKVLEVLNAQKICPSYTVGNIPENNILFIPDKEEQCKKFYETILQPILATIKNAVKHKESYAVDIKREIANLDKNKAQIIIQIQSNLFPPAQNQIQPQDNQPQGNQVQEDQSQVNLGKKKDHNKLEQAYNRLT